VGAAGDDHRVPLPRHGGGVKAGDVRRAGRQVQERLERHTAIVGGRHERR
jgi:hypothetical protein